MSMEQADLLEAWIAALPGVERATVRERTNGVTVLYHGSEKALRSALARFSFAEAARALPPATSALLHNASTLLLSMKSLTNLLHEEGTKEHEVS